MNAKRCINSISLQSLQYIFERNLKRKINKSINKPDKQANKNNIRNPAPFLQVFFSHVIYLF